MSENRVSSGDAAARSIPPRPDPAAVLGRVPTGVSLRRELAAAARSLGRTPSVAAEIDEIEAEIATIEVEPIDLTAARRRVAETGGEIEQLKERVAALRGEAQARREVNADADEVLAELETAAAELSATQTRAIAARQALERARVEAARARDERQRRLKLRDRLRNRRRAARRELAESVYPAFRRALAVVPVGDPSDAGREPDAYDGPAVAASLAAVRVASIDGAVELRGEAARVVERAEAEPRALLRVDRVLTEGSNCPPDRHRS